MHVEQRHVPLADSPVKLYARIDRDLLPSQQSDAAAEKRNELLGIPAETQAEVILICSFKEERSLLERTAETV